MKRRGFLTLFGSAATAPLMPSMGAAAAPLYSRTAFSRAVMHAQLRPHVSARGIAHRLKLSLPQAEGMIAEMAAKGLVRPVAGGGGVHVRAVSAIVKPQAWGTGAAARNARSQAAARRQRDLTRTNLGKPAPQPGATPLMAHLYGLCHAYGLELSPRCAHAEALA